MMDRLSRLDQDDSYQIVRRCWKAGVEVHVPYENRIVSNLNDLMTVISNALRYQGAKDYTDALKERLTQAWALKRAKANGEQPLTRNISEWLDIEGRVCAGNKIIKPGTFVLNKKADVVREVFRLASLGIGCKTISKKFPNLLSRHGKNYLTVGLLSLYPIGRFWES